jgi:hypothetical protein
MVITEREIKDQESQMLRVLLVANDSLLADGIESLLAQQTGLDMLRLSTSQLSSHLQAIREHRPGAIIVETGDFDAILLTMHSWLWGNGHVRIIAIDPVKQKLQIVENYQILVSEVAQLFDLIRGSIGE